MCEELMMERIPVSGPWITQKEVDYVADAAKHAWYANANMYHDRFEEAFSRYIGVRFAVALPSCTAAIHLSLAAVGVGIGDEVIVPDVTWIASAAPIQYVGATPVFGDIDRDTWCLSSTSLEECITKKTKAVIAVDLYGSMPDMDAIRDICRSRRVFLIEDAAEAIGSQYGNGKAGSFGDTGVFSFHGSKTLTTGEGGMLVTDNEDIYKRVLILRDHGRQPGDTLFRNEEVAYKYKMSSMQAALGLAQLERVQDLLDQKRKIFSWYKEDLSEVPGLRLNYESEKLRNSFWMTTAILEDKYKMTKERIIDEMKCRKIDCRPFFYPLSSLPAYSGTPQAEQARNRNRVSYQISPRGVNLPSGLNLTREAVAYVSTAYKAILF